MERMEVPQTRMGQQWRAWWASTRMLRRRRWRMRHRVSHAAGFRRRACQLHAALGHGAQPAHASWCSACLRAVGTSPRIFQCVPLTTYSTHLARAEDYDDGGFDGGDDGGYYSADEGEEPAGLPADGEAAAAEGGAAEQVGRLDADSRERLCAPGCLSGCSACRRLQQWCGLARSAWLEWVRHGVAQALCPARLLPCFPAASGPAATACGRAPGAGCHPVAD